jgi:hypothetical protein
MSNPTTLDIAERIACAICWLARQPGLPEITDLRHEVSKRHANGCQWCEFPLSELIGWCSLAAAPGVAEFGRLPASAQRRLVIRAMGLGEGESA